ncbi:hypothetical protein [Candidatus Odyssella thessalonicensis]|uniref:hypothetical protein n=1 Tax=Candidatus Odyssella thessalonicensis TaxID=84647 RepID=UPI000225C1C2|nr:hypothetical protein [Candidatus Odyssella thessalonicensis]
MRLSLLLLGSVLTVAQAYTPYGGEGGEQNPQGAPLPATTQTDVPPAIIADDAIAQHQQLYAQLDEALEALIAHLGDECADEIVENYDKEIQAKPSQSGLIGMRTQILMSMYNSPVIQKKIEEDLTSRLKQKVEQEVPADQREAKKVSLDKKLELVVRSMKDHVVRQVQNVIEGKSVEQRVKQAGKKTEKEAKRVANDVNEAIEEGKVEREVKKGLEKTEKVLNRAADDIQEAIEQGKVEREVEKGLEKTEKVLNRAADDTQEAIEEGKVEREVKKAGKKFEKEGKKGIQKLKKKWRF